MGASFPVFHDLGGAGATQVAKPRIVLSGFATYVAPTSGYAFSAFA